MKKIIAIVITLFLSVAFGLVANAQVPKEGTLSGTVNYAGTHKLIPLDKERAVLVYDNMGVRLEDGGQGPFHGLSTHNMGITYYLNFASDHDLGG